LITDDWKKEIASLPFVSKKKGRMSALLKQKSKIIKIKKDRKKYPAFDFKKRLRTSDNKEDRNTPAQSQTKDEEMKNE